MVTIKSGAISPLISPKRMPNASRPLYGTMSAVILFQSIFILAKGDSKESVASYRIAISSYNNFHREKVVC